MKFLLNAFRGFMMALADSVPGVSGGSIAFILGFYDLFINSLHNIIFGDLKKKKEAFLFLMNLGAGWIIGMATASIILASVFNKYIYELSSLFLGFIIVSIFVIFKEDKEYIKGHYLNSIYLFLGVFIVVMITYFSGSTFGTYDITNLNLSLGLYLFLAGAVAISAMILPGISGSTLLLIFGLYMPIISGIKELFKFNFECLPAFIIFGLGVLFGVVFLTKTLKSMLTNHRSIMIYLIIGLMIGSLYSIVMGPLSISSSNLPLNISNFSAIFFIIGIGLVYALEKIKKL